MPSEVASARPRFRSPTRWGAPVFGTSRTAAKLEQTKRLGMDHGIDASREDFVEVVAQRRSGRGVDVVIDLLGGSVLAGQSGGAGAPGPAGAGGPARRDSRDRST